MPQVTPSRLVAAFTRTSGLATHITPELDHWVGVAARGSQARFTCFVGNQPELSLTSLAPARSPLPRGVTVYPGGCPAAVFS
jgi:hypothetical protein